EGAPPSEHRWSSGSGLRFARGARNVNKRTPVHAAAYFLRILSRNVFESAVTLQASGQKHRSTHHQSLGTPAWFSAGSSLSKSSLPVPNGLCVLVLCSFRVPSESIRWTCVILPLSFSSSSRTPPGSVSFVPIWLAPTTAHMWAWQLSNSTPKFGLPRSRTALTRAMTSDGLLNGKPGSNSHPIL